MTTGLGTLFKFPKFLGSTMYTSNLQSLFQPYTRETQNTYYRDKLMLKSLPTEGKEPAVKAVT
jgi:hypothetical protein